MCFREKTAPSTSPTASASLWLWPHRCYSAAPQAITHVLIVTQEQSLSQGFQNFYRKALGCAHVTYQDRGLRPSLWVLKSSRGPRAFMQRVLAAGGPTVTTCARSDTVLLYEHLCFWSSCRNLAASKPLLWLFIRMCSKAKLRDDSVKLERFLLHLEKQVDSHEIQYAVNSIFSRHFTFTTLILAVYSAVRQHSEVIWCPDVT